MLSRRQHVLAFLAYLVLAVVLTWPLTIHLGDLLGGGLDPVLQSWILAWDAQALLHNPLAIWQAPIFFPYPDTLAYTDHHLPQMLLAAPIIWATHNPALAHNLLVLLSYALSGWAVSLLALDLLKPGTGARSQESAVRISSASESTWVRSKQHNDARLYSRDLPFSWADHLPAFVAGAAFAFCSFRMAQFVHLQMLQTAWLPLALLFLRRTLRDGMLRDGLLCGLFFAIQCITALYFSYFAALTLGLYAGLWVVLAIWRRVRHGTQLPWKPLASLAAGGVLAALIIVPFTLPYIRVYQSLGIIRSARELENWSAPLQAYLAVDPGNRLLGSLALMSASGGEFALFPGATVSLLALLGMLAGLRRSTKLDQSALSPRLDTIFLLLLALIAFVLSLGTTLRLVRGGTPLAIPLPYALLYERLPGFGALRVPARWGMLVALAACLLAARGLRAITSWPFSPLPNPTGGERREEFALGQFPSPRRGSRGQGVRGRSIFLPLIALALILAESATSLPLTTAPNLNTAPPIYRWLSEPAQADVRAVLELPSGRTQRGDELEKTMRRQYYGTLHWKPLATGYSGLIPFGTTDLLGRAQGLPNEQAIRFLQLSGIDTLVLHRDEYPPDQFQMLISGLDATPLAHKRATIGEAFVYTLLPFDGIGLPDGASVVLTGDERAPGLPALALVRRWSQAGVRLYGPGRVRYYGPLATPQPGQVFDYGLLADTEDPRPYGFTQAGKRWQAAGLALYTGDPALRASLELGVVPANQFHPASPATLELIIDATRMRIAGREIGWSVPITSAYVELDLASLNTQDLLVDDTRMPLQPGANTLSIPVTVGQPLRITGSTGQVALLRVRIRDGAGPASGSAIAPEARLALAATSTFSGSRLAIGVQVGGQGALLVEARGAAALDDRPILLFTGIQPVPSNRSGSWSFSVDLLNPADPAQAWIQKSGQAQDGRYLVYLKDPNHPDGPGLAIAKFNLRAGRVVDAEAVPLPLTELR